VGKVTHYNVGYLLTHQFPSVMPRKKQETNKEGLVEVFAAYITRKGKRIPPPKGQKVWHFWAKPKNAA
jgi:hypothetical protein